MYNTGQTSIVIRTMLDVRKNSAGQYLRILLQIVLSIDRSSTVLQDFFLVVLLAILEQTITIPDEFVIQY